jgi:hypothetical protein
MREVKTRVFSCEERSWGLKYHVKEMMADVGSKVIYQVGGWSRSVAYKSKRLIHEIEKN